MIRLIGIETITTITMTAVRKGERAAGANQSIFHVTAILPYSTICTQCCKLNEFNLTFNFQVLKINFNI